ncbi:MAG: CoA transferase [Candidatus Limnocylindrales bacterium]
MERWGLGPDVLRALNPKLGHRADLRVRPDRTVLAASRLRHGGRVDQRLRPHQRPAGRSTDAAAVRPGRRRGLVVRDVRDDVRALPPRPASTHPGQVIDLAIYEPLFWLLGPQALVYDQLGYVQGRTGSSTEWTAPRNAYQSSDGKWLGLSASSQSIAERVMRLVGHPGGHR